MPRLLSVNVGLPRDVTWNGKTVGTAVWKSPLLTAEGECHSGSLREDLLREDL